MDAKADRSMPILVLIATEFEISPSLEARWLADLPAVRQTEISRWPDRKARHRSLIGSRLLLLSLRRFGYAEACLATLRHSPSSRPTLDLPLEFSLSHGDGRVVSAVSRTGPIGVDVEAVENLSAQAFGYFLNENERAWAGHDPRRFYSIWTRKEAVAKAAGRGLADVRSVDTGGAEQGAEFAGKHWQTVALPVGMHYVAHLACPMDRQLRDCLAIEQLSRHALEHGEFSVDSGETPDSRRPIRPFLH
ncbi:4'-phosphopantetheinyl transferase family protein [Xylophilus sp. GOD-11R]|uniref:4'-phosphopantetheinyl transferase family protein n=1 Tax=Xylophilus sp. GOD-11R TaxID=3089814 RepID=UPI00298CAD31|nr:4'-phosphopantetheinyl transferase superfamily protein [Xylophilus sp. GOD-11R]WPB58961.1 4'-phosphopantetheinyl transferase superfamily protein [Xylophilus sp. GOD-11R]